MNRQETDRNQADRVAYERMVASRPAWTGLSTAERALGLTGRTVLHAGPPIPGDARIPAPIVNSAAVAAVLEGWADDLDQGLALVNRGGVQFRAAQDHDAVTPLATVISPSMTVQLVEDMAGGGRTMAAPFNGGMGAVMRYGQRTAEVLEKVRWLDGPLKAVLLPALERPVDLISLADHGLHRGDDCHGRPAEATKALTAELRQRLGAEMDAYDVAAFLEASPPFFLNLWMAASKCILSAAAGVDGSGLVVAMAGNGNETGLQVSSLPGRWFTAPATPPQGAVRDGFGQADRLGAIGDSAVVEALGLGAMTWFDYGTDLQDGLEDCLPADGPARPAALLAGPHPAFTDPKPPVGLSVFKVRETGMTPLVSLGMVDRSGEGGLLGRGIYEVSAAPFLAAAEAIDG